MSNYNDLNPLERANLLQTTIKTEVEAAKAPNVPKLSEIEKWERVQNYLVSDDQHAKHLINNIIADPLFLTLIRLGLALPSGEGYDEKEYSERSDLYGKFIARYLALVRATATNEFINKNSGKYKTPSYYCIDFWDLYYDTKTKLFGVHYEL